MNPSSTKTQIDRRSFLSAALAAAVFKDLARVTAIGGPVLNIGVLTGGADARGRHDGALLGVEEAKHAAQLFGGGATLIPLESPSRATPSLAAILGDDSLDTAKLLARRANHGSYIYMNVACPADELRGMFCAPFMFHVAPSNAMFHDARAQVPAATEVVAWDGALFRFGADTLNDRFRKRFGRSMTPAAWAAWFAVKALWESSLRMKSADPKQLAEYLTRDTTQFDGHKGRPLSFRQWDHQLRQFLYARVGGKLVDVPQTAATADASSRNVLDALGQSAEATTCRFSR